MDDCNKAIAVAVDLRDQEIIRMVREMITDWEDRMGDEGDKTLYTLGLRRVVDAIKGDTSV